MTLSQFWYTLVAAYLAFLLGFATLVSALVLLAVRAILRSIK